MSFPPRKCFLGDQKDDFWNFTPFPPPLLENVETESPRCRPLKIVVILTATGVIQFKLGTGFKHTYGGIEWLVLPLTSSFLLKYSSEYLTRAWEVVNTGSTLIQAANNEEGLAGQRTWGLKGQAWTSVIFNLVFFRAFTVLLCPSQRASRRSNFKPHANLLNSRELGTFSLF